MNISSNNTSTLCIVFINCTSDEPPKVDPATTDWQAYHVSHSAEDLCQQMATGLYDCVVALFDPASQQSAEQLETVCGCARKYSVPLASLTTFNPPWINHLMRHFDVTRHFNDVPTETQLRMLVVPQAKKRDLTQPVH